MMMTDERLLALIETYGAEPMAWPEDERDAATAHLAADPLRFETALQDARLIDAAFTIDDTPEMPAGLTERVLAAAPEAAATSKGFGSRLRAIIMPHGARWPAGAALASLMMGLVGGYATAATAASEEYPTTAETVVYTALGYDGLSSFMDEVDG
ncbi:hypothetical protein WNY37_12975 [Henriciella sp. AS95]|uniref:hypothetical protein n=1 Tax=Henriciella sp. AS95 TaxID=3135782 RepID=UPI0031735FEC